MACHKLRLFILYLLFIYYSFFQWQRKGKFCLYQANLLQFRARVVPENILKKTERDAKVLKALKDSRAKAKTERAAARKVAAENAEKYYNEYTKEENELIANKRDAKKNGSFFVEAEPKVAFIVRIKG